MCVFIPHIENSKHQHLWVPNDCHWSEDCDYCGTERLLLERDVYTDTGLFCKSAHHILVYRAVILKYLFIFLIICNAVCVISLSFLSKRLYTHARCEFKGFWPMKKDNFVSEGFQNSSWPCVPPCSHCLHTPFQTSIPFNISIPYISQSSKVDGWLWTNAGPALRIFSQSLYGISFVEE